MTEVWDTVQEFLGHLAHVTDQELYETGIRMIADVISSIHDIDHILDQRVSRGLDRTSAMKEIRDILRKMKERRR